MGSFVCQYMGWLCAERIGLLLAAGCKCAHQPRWQGGAQRLWGDGESGEGHAFIPAQNLSLPGLHQRCSRCGEMTADSADLLHSFCFVVGM